MDNDFLLLTIYNVYESIRYYEHENKVELPTVRGYLENVLDQLTPERLAELHSRSASALLNEELGIRPTWKK